MIRYKSQKQLTLERFSTPLDMVLDPGNRWVKLSDCILWDELAESYHKTLSSRLGPLIKDARIVIGAVIIKHKLSVSDDETVEQIRENPYLQYFIALKGFQSEAPFASSLLVDVRKRMGQAVFDRFHEVIIEAVEQSKTKKSVKIGDDDNDEGDACTLDHGEADSENDAAEMTVEQPLADKVPRNHG
ncbi:Transposase domain [Nitrosomonas aestuarii]|uniref:Transposase domain n=1 Tax=Nitrosomonas aestuarii TaxID=52441 RepID=A0A1I4AUA5_9PROT|nr:transposase [Nitrosomonas aestuarii]SFK59820.1 Transposase domain [Nitrosomonas aestuarii]